MVLNAIRLIGNSAMTTALAPAPAPAKAPAGIEPSIPNKVRAAFAFLPEQATGAPRLADFFIEIGIQGRRNDKLFCPVASYLRAVTGYGNIRVGTLNDGEDAERFSDDSKPSGRGLLHRSL